MMHFLGRLVARARGTAPLVEPIIAPRFAPAQAMDIASEREASPPVRREAGERETTGATDGPVVRKEESATRETDARLVEKTVKAAPQTLLVPVERTGGEVVHRPDWTRGTGALRRDSPRRVQSDTAPVVVRRGNHHPQSAIPRSSDRPAVSANSLTVPNESASNERPIVRVTIGRIEVRAESAPPPPRKTAPRPGPELTLDAYLKSRKEGAR